MLSYDKRSILNDNKVIVFIILISFFIISISLPIYDNVNGFHNLLFDDYELTWYDGKSPLNFHIIKNILEGKSIFFPEGYLIGNIKVEKFFDFREKDGSFFPKFNFLSNYIYAGILYLIPLSSNFQLFKATVFLTIIFSSITLSFFYLIQRLLGLDKKYSFISTFIAGVATSILIYSRYLFIDHTLMSLMFVSLIYILLKNQKKRSFKIEIFAVIIFSFFIVFLWYEFLILIFLVVLTYLFIKYKLIRSKKILILPILIILLMFIPIDLLYFGGTPKTSPSGIKDMIRIWVIPIFRVFSNYINALDYSIFGYHNQTSVWKLYRGFAPIYAFEELKGNAIFLASYGLFGSLFGTRGIIFNSPYLIFSILGIFAYKRKKERNFLLAIIILIILCYGLFHIRWQGGLSPRYLRYYTIPVLFLTFFSFYYIQETKNNWVKLIFVILVILSVLNVTSLAIRADWTYEHPAELVSYDLVLWPWYPPTEKLSNETTILLTSAEIPKWKLSGENDCKASFGVMGLVTDPCQCRYDSWAERKIRLENDMTTIKIEACADIAGNDGTRGLVYVDNKLVGELLIESDSCITKSFEAKITKGVHTIKLKSGIYGSCKSEMVFWKSIKFGE